MFPLDLGVMKTYSCFDLPKTVIRPTPEDFMRLPVSSTADSPCSSTYKKDLSEVPDDPMSFAFPELSPDPLSAHMPSEVSACIVHNCPICQNLSMSRTPQSERVSSRATGYLRMR